MSFAVSPCAVCAAVRMDGMDFHINDITIYIHNDWIHILVEPICGFHLPDSLHRARRQRCHFHFGIKTHYCHLKICNIIANIDIATPVPFHSIPPRSSSNVCIDSAWLSLYYVHTLRARVSIHCSCRLYLFYHCILLDSYHFNTKSILHDVKF